MISLHSSTRACPLRLGALYPLVRRPLDALRRVPIFSGRDFFLFLGRVTFSGAFFIFGNWRLPAIGLKPLFFRYRVIMVMLAECQRFLARADFPPLIGLRGAFAAARGGFWRPDLKCEKMRLLKINNLRRKLSDYYSLHARPRARGGGRGAPQNRPFPHYQYIGP